LSKLATESMGRPSSGPTGQLARNGSDATGDRCHQNPGHDGVRGISADDEVGTALLVRALSPPQLASSYHHFSHGSSSIDSIASAVARRTSSSVSGWADTPSANAWSIVRAAASATMRWSPARTTSDRLANRSLSTSRSTAATSSSGKLHGDLNGHAWSIPIRITTLSGSRPTRRSERRITTGCGLRRALLCRAPERGGGPTHARQFIRDPGGGWPLGRQAGPPGEFPPTPAERPSPQLVPAVSEELRQGSDPRRHARS
jgi:hypothetical protein